MYCHFAKKYETQTSGTDNSFSLCFAEQKRKASFSEPFFFLIFIISCRSQIKPIMIYIASVSPPTAGRLMQKLRGVQDDMLPHQPSPKQHFGSKMPPNRQKSPKLSLDSRKYQLYSSRLMAVRRNRKPAVRTLQLGSRAFAVNSGQNAVCAYFPE